MTTWKDNIGFYEIIYRSSSIVTEPAVGSHLLAIETPYGGKLLTLELAATEANIFNVVIRDTDGANPITRKMYRLYADGQYVDAETFDEPILEWGANKEIAVLTVDDPGLDKRYVVNMKIAVPRV